jgi:signal transduction histidine kinase
VPLFHKLLLANGLLVGGAGVVVFLGASLLGGLGERAATIASLLFLTLVLLLGALVNAIVIRLALSPLEALEHTALRVQEGDYTARAPDSPLADEAMERLVRLFNHVLDGVEAYRVRRQELAIRVLQAEERERERVAHELYQGTAQTLAGVLVRLRLAERCADPAELATSVSGVRDAVAHALDEIRGVARQLRPPELDELGVRAALEAHGRYLTEGRGIRVAFRGRVPESCLGRDATLALFRIVQEAISNAVLHSGGTTVLVSFRPEEPGIVAEITDDGCGFDPERTLLGGSGGFGLLGMRERAGYVAGTLAVDSTPTGGTTVRVIVPWSTEPPARRDEEELDPKLGASLRVLHGSEAFGPAGPMEKPYIRA